MQSVVTPGGWGGQASQRRAWEAEGRGVEARLPSDMPRVCCLRGPRAAEPCQDRAALGAPGRGLCGVFGRHSALARGQWWAQWRLCVHTRAPGCTPRFVLRCKPLPWSYARCLEVCVSQAEETQEKVVLL